MSSGIPTDKLYLERLRTEYEIAFEEWAFQVKRLQTIAGSAPSSVVKETEARVVAAERVYRRSRDRLTDTLLNLHAEANRCEDNKSFCAAQ
jgi:hypothetical protein